MTAATTHRATHHQTTHHNHTVDGAAGTRGGEGENEGATMGNDAHENAQTTVIGRLIRLGHVYVLWFNHCTGTSVGLEQTTATTTSDSLTPAPLQQVDERP